MNNFLFFYFLDTHNILIKSCYVDDGQGNRNEILDNQGFHNFILLNSGAKILSPTFFFLRAPGPERGPSEFQNQFEI